MQRKTKSATQKQLRRSWSPLIWMTLLTHTQPHRSVYSSKKNYQHCRGPLSGFMRESGFQAQSKFYRKKISGVQNKSPVTILNSSERRSRKFLRRNRRRWSARHELFRECYLPAWLKGEDWRNETVIWRWGSSSNNWIKARLWERLQIKESNGVATRHMHLTSVQCTKQWWRKQRGRRTDDYSHLHLRGLLRKGVKVGRSEMITTITKIFP